MARRQSLVQLSDELIARLDERASSSGRSRSALIREAIEAYLATDEQAAIDALIVQAYQRFPQEADRWADVAARDAIAVEAW